jgi:hypothetical protein
MTTDPVSLPALCYGAGSWWLHRLALARGPAPFPGASRTAASGRKESP